MSEVLEALRFLPSYLSPRFLEYLFAFCRAEHRNASAFGALAGKVHVDHYLYVTLLEFKLGVAAPTSRRTASRGPARIDWARGTLEAIRSTPDGAISNHLDVGARRLLSGTPIAHPDQRGTLPSLEELKSVPLLPEASRKAIFLRDLTLERHRGTSSVASSESDPDSDDEVPTDDDDEHDAESGDEQGDEDDPIPDTPEGLREMLQQYGLPPRGTTRSMRQEIKNYRSARASADIAARYNDDRRGGTGGGGGGSSSAEVCDGAACCIGRWRAQDGEATARVRRSRRDHHVLCGCGREGT